MMQNCMDSSDYGNSIALPFDPVPIVTTDQPFAAQAQSSPGNMIAMAGRGSSTSSWLQLAASCTDGRGDCRLDGRGED